MQRHISPACARVERMSGQVDYDRESGKCAYEAYQRATQAESANGNAVPDWEHLPSSVQETWITVASAVRQHDHERITQF